MEIWRHIATDNLPAAERMFDRLEQRIHLLAEFGEMGRVRDELELGLRQLVEGPYLILYRILGDEIEVVRVVHGARDVEGLF